MTARSPFAAPPRDAIRGQLAKDLVEARQEIERLGAELERLRTRLAHEIRRQRRVAPIAVRTWVG